MTGAPPDVSVRALPEDTYAASLASASVPALMVPPNNFDFLRLLLAVLVIVSHSAVLFSPRAANYAFQPMFLFTRGQQGFGSFAVAGFFALSGFLTTHSFLRSKSLFHYLWKRMLRIYP